ncbi:MAG: Mbov_0395 family pilin-like conjugal transfer protein [Christensenellales bacterium]
MKFLLGISKLLADLTAVSNEVNDILNKWVGPIFLALGGVAAVYVIILGVQYAKSENDSKKAEVKSRIINCIIGLLAIIVIGVVCIEVDWASFVQIFGYM